MGVCFVDYVDDKDEQYHVIRDAEDFSIITLPTRYLVYKKRRNLSPNTIRKAAFSICYYLNYLDESALSVQEVFDMPYFDQHLHFTGFLKWLKAGKHTELGRIPRNDTCNLYLRDVFCWYQYMERRDAEFGSLKVMENRRISYVRSSGVRSSRVCAAFTSYLPSEGHRNAVIREERILTLLQNCSNVRDQLLILLLAETGFRIGEMLGVRYTKDIDYQRKTIRVHFRSDNTNRSRAKNAEERRAQISAETFEILMYYLSENRELIRKGEYLFITENGKNAGAPLTNSNVYSMFKRLKEKTGISITPHMLRHYYAEVRRKEGWPFLLLSAALGHRSVLTTQVYLHVDQAELDKAAEEFFGKKKGLYPVEGLL